MSDNAQDSERVGLENEALRQRIAMSENEKDSPGAEGVASWRHFIDEVPIGIATVGLDKRFLTCNAAFCAFLGYSEQELQQKTISEITHPEDVAIGMADLGAIVAGDKKTARLEKRYVRKDGTVVWGEVSINLVRNSQGQPLYFMPYILDTTERKRAEELLRDNELKYRVLFETAEGAILLFADGRWIDCNAKALSVFGCTREEILGAHPSRFSPPTQPDGRPSEPEAARLITLAYTTGSQSFEWEHCRADGTTFAAEVNLNRVYLGGKPHIQAIVHDISNRRRTEASLKENIALLQSAGRISRFGGWSVDVANNRCAWSDEVARIHEEPPGYSPLVEDGINYYAPEWRDRITKVFSACVQDGTPYDEELEIITAKGKRLWVRTCAEAVRDEAGKVVKVYGGFQDITERKRVEYELRASNALFAAFVNHSPIYAFIKAVTPTESRVLQASDNFREMIGHAGADILGKTMAELFPAEFATKITADDWAVASSGEVLKIDEDLNGRNYSSIKFPIVHEGRTFLAGYTIDITERKRAEREVQESKQLMESVVENVPLMIFLKEAQDLRFVVFNRAGEELLGYDRKDLLGKNALDLFPPEQAAHFVAKDREVLAEGALLDIPEEPILTAKKGTRLLHTRKGCIKGADGVTKYLLGISEDITERKQAEAKQAQLEEQLRASQKMEAIGSLAGGIAHDFNNLLSVILSYTEFAMARVRNGDPLKSDLLEVVNAGERAAALTRQLLAFSRKQIRQPVALDLNQIAEGVEKMLQRILGEDIALVQRLAPDLGLTMADPGQLEQVLMNLVVNARDAMPEGGKLIIETSNVEIDEEFAARHMAVTPGSYVQLAVSDTGCGMDEQTRARIFEPFFTTKEQGKGTGLGLSTVYGIVKQSGGSIWVYSEPGQGTTFKIYLPRELCATTVTVIKTSTIPRLFTGTETILVVEDEDALRKIAKRSLEAAGYRVLTASDGHEALLVSAEHAGDIQLLLTDVVMPRMSGRVLAQELAKTRPSVKVVYMSGYTDDAIVHHGVLDAGTHFLAKPFTSADLTRKAREVLDDGTVCVAGAREPAAKDDASPMIDCGGRYDGAPAKRPALSQRWREEAELRNSQKLEAIGSLAAGIAHEINTPAQYVSDSLHFLLEACGAQKQLAASHRSAAAALSEAGGHETLVTAMRRVEEEIDLDYLEENVPHSLTLCRDGLARISSIVHALKSFSQQGTHDRAPADLNAALQTTLTVCRNEYKYVAEIETDLGELPLVSCNLGDLNQVFLSLIVNAAHAVADAALQRGGMGKIRVTSRTDGQNVRIDISDTGAGIPEAIRGRVFEPFFTTKPMGRGIGQSLAIARSIIEEHHGGRLTFESIVNVGTTFTIELPSEPLAAGDKTLPPGQATQRAEKRRPRILVIDDEPPIGVAMGRVLRREFEVVLATGGAQALDLVASDQSFDVLLCDLQMPEMSGMDFHDRLLARWPQLASRIVFMSGGASTARAQDFLESANRPWLTKPVEPAELVSTMRSILTDKRSP